MFVNAEDTADTPAARDLETVHEPINGVSLI